jgi:hypothetical protein
MPANQPPNCRKPHALHRRAWLETAISSAWLARTAHGNDLPAPDDHPASPAPVLASGALLAHWPLAGDVRDLSGNEHHGVNHGADLSAEGPEGKAKTAARFDGRGFLEISGNQAPLLGGEDFTISLWVHTEPKLDSILGDLLSYEEPGGRRGLSVGFAHGTLTSSQPNHRNLFFGIDRGTLGTWADQGRPGRSVYTMALAVFAGQLYAATCEPDEGQSGGVYRLDGDHTWTSCGSPDPCNAVSALAVHEGALYAGVARYRLAGSSLPESPNRAPGGRVYRYDGGTGWVDCGKLGDAEAIGCLAVFRGQLYGTSTYSPGVFRYEGGSVWTPCGSGPGGKRIVSLGVFDGQLYGTSYDGGWVFRYEGGTQWSLIGEIPGATQTYSLAVFHSRLHVSTWPRGEVYRFEGDANWAFCGRLGEELEVMPLASWNGRLYGGTLPLAQVYRYEEGTAWTLTGQLDQTPEVRYRRAWSMAVYRGRLWCGTLPSGRVFAYQADPCATCDDSLPAGWNHVAALRRGSELELFVNGRLVGRSLPFQRGQPDPGPAGSWRIGSGPQGGFQGRLSDLRLYRGALTETQLRELARRS